MTARLFSIPVSLACADTWPVWLWHVIFLCWGCRIEFHGLCAYLLPIRLISHNAVTLNVSVVTMTMELIAGCWHSLDTICDTLFISLNIFMFPGDVCPQSHITKPRVYWNVSDLDQQPLGPRAISDPTLCETVSLSGSQPLSYKLKVSLPTPWDYCENKVFKRPI